MKFTETSVSTQKEILKRKLGGELFEGITLDASAFTNGVCKAGNPIDANGKAVNGRTAGTTDAAPVGILLSDVYEDNPNGTIVKAFACVNEANANANANITIADSVKTALKLIVFE
nr:MAG TPA: hypothetical protein [Caudoviricetes sp.]